MLRGTLRGASRFVSLRSLNDPGGVLRSLGDPGVASLAQRSWAGSADANDGAIERELVVAHARLELLERQGPGGLQPEVVVNPVSDALDTFLRMRDQRSGSDSRCCDADGAPWDWMDYRDERQASEVALADWLNSLSVFARNVEIGEIEDLFEAAAEGLLWDSGDETTPIKPIRADPEIFELRRTALTKKLRFYHGEPAELPSTLLALHRHIKIDGTSQQVEIKYSAERYRNGHASLWT